MKVRELISKQIKVSQALNLVRVSWGERGPRYRRAATNTHALDFPIRSAWEGWRVAGKTRGGATSRFKTLTVTPYLTPISIMS